MGRIDAPRTTELARPSYAEARRTHHPFLSHLLPPIDDLFLRGIVSGGYFAERPSSPIPHTGMIDRGVSPDSLISPNAMRQDTTTWDHATSSSQAHSLPLEPDRGEKGR